MNPSERLYINNLTVSMIETVRREFGFSLTRAMDTVYGSDTFSRLERPETGLYTYSSLSICDILLKELFTGTAPVYY
ncbi:MAG: hypothetical protein MJZ07_09685, partial [Bacteroidales bacterium]|nr:hypothetical protein [Bacteroidales bacterium]